jgi:TRAP-type transport system small permease protein
MERLGRGYGAILQGLAGLAAGLVALMLLGVTADVLLRNLLTSGIRGIVEYTEFGLYLATVLAAPWLLRQGQHIRADLLGQFASGASLKAIDALSDALGLGVSAVVGWYALQSAIESYRLGSVLRRTVEIPEWLLVAPLALSMALLCGEFGVRLRRTLAGQRQADTRSAA